MSNDVSEKDRPVRVSVYAKDGPSSSASYYRVLQYVPTIEAASGAEFSIRVLVPDWLRRARYNIVGRQGPSLVGLVVRVLYNAVGALRGLIFLLLDLVRGPDAVVIVRSIFPRTFFPPVSWAYQRLLARTPRVVWDFDDDILASGEIARAEFEMLARLADVVSVTHQDLGALLAGIRNDAVAVPTTDGNLRDHDWGAATERRLATFGSYVRAVWVGSSSGLQDLSSIEPQLEAAAERLRVELGKRLIVEVVCNQPLEAAPSNYELINTKWTRERGLRALDDAHIGLMPLLDNEFAQGKGAFKAVQYMAAGIPPLASAVGFNVTAVEDNVGGYLIAPDNPHAWAESIVGIARDQDNWATVSLAARGRWEAAFSAENVEEFWLRSLLEQPSGKAHEVTP